MKPIDSILTTNSNLTDFCPYKTIDSAGNDQKPNIKDTISNDEKYATTDSNQTGDHCTHKIDSEDILGTQKTIT